MKLVGIIFVFLSFTVFKALVLETTNTDPPTFPTMSFPDLDFATIPDGCGGFTDCIEYVGKVLVNFVLGIVFVTLLIFNLLVFIGALFLVVAEITVTGIDGAPWYINVVTFTPFIAMIGVILYRMIRKGDAQDG